MTNVELIQKLAKITAEHGELTVMLETDDNSLFEAGSVTVEVSDGRYPSDWNMPKGYKFILISS
jgi:hypothetical protein